MEMKRLLTVLSLNKKRKSWIEKWNISIGREDFLLIKPEM